MDAIQLRTIALALRQQLDALDAALAPETPTSTVMKVSAGQDLQAALDKAGAIELEAGATWSGSYTVRSNTTLVGNGASIKASTGPALRILPGSSNIAISGLICISGYNEVIRIGENTAAQTTAAQAPNGITFTDVQIPTHRGKRAWAIHGQNVALLNCSAVDVWDPAGQDSQAIYVGNSPGNIRIVGGRYSAGSEVFLSGGDTYNIPHVTPDGIVCDGVNFFRPLSWKTDGTKRKVKNIFELKNGLNVVVKNCNLSGCWMDGQQGEAFTLTPALDGAIVQPPLQSGDVRFVIIEDCVVTDVSSGFNILGRHYTSYTPDALTGLVVRRLKLTASRAQFGGRGQLATIGGEPDAITFEDCDIVCDGSSTIYYSSGSVLDPVTRQSRTGGKLVSLTVTNSRITLGSYGFNFGGYPNAVNWQNSVGTLNVSGNVFKGPTTMQKQLPNNTYGA